MKRWQFWLILVPLFAWFGRDGLRAQTQLNLSQIKAPPPGTRQLIWSETIAPQLPDGSYLLPIPVAPPGTTQTIVTMGPAVFKNNVRQTSGSDYTIIPGPPARLVPSTPWLAADIVLVEYWSVVNNGPTQAAPFPLPLTFAVPYPSSGGTGISMPAKVSTPQPRKSWIRRLLTR